MTYTSVVSYLRISSTEQTKGSGLEGQRIDATNGAARLGVVITEELVEAGKSAFFAKHRAEGSVFHSYEADVLAGLRHGSLLILSKLDRLTREGVDETLEILRNFNRAGVTIYTHDDQELYEAGKRINMHQAMKALIKAEVAMEEGQKKSDRGKLNYDIKQAHCRANKLAVTKNVAPWLTVHDDRTTSLNDRAAVYAEIMRLCGDDKLGAERIARVLHKRKVPFISARAKRQASGWTRTNIGKVLKDRSAIGEFQPTRGGKPNGEPWPDHFPRLVSTELFERVQQECAARKRDSTSNRDEKVSNLFSGLAKCGCCGRNLTYVRGRSAGAQITTKNGTTYTYRRDNGSLVCDDGKMHRCANRSYLAYLTFENTLLTAALHLAMDDAAFARKDEVGRLNVTIAEREREYAIAMETATNLATAWAAKPTDMRRQMADEAEEKAEGIHSNLMALKSQREDAKGRVSSQEHLARVADIRANLYHEDLSVRVPLRKRVFQALKNVIHSITVDANGEATVVFDGGLVAFKIKGKTVLPINDTVAAIRSGVIPLPRGGDRAVQSQIVQRLKKSARR